MKRKHGKTIIELPSDENYNMIIGLGNCSETKHGTKLTLHGKSIINCCYMQTKNLYYMKKRVKAI